MQSKQPLSYKRLARDQQRLAWFTAFFVAAHVIFVCFDFMHPSMGALSSLAGIIWIALYLGCAIKVGSIASQLGMHSVVVAAIAILACVPFFSLIPIVGVQARLNRFWKTLGLRPSIFGVDPLLAEGLQHGTRCAACGYDLQGNESGVCPECGKAVADFKK